MGSFRKRLLVLIIGLVIVTQTVTLGAVLAKTRETVETRSREQLASGGKLALNVMRSRSGDLANGVAVTAADFGFREAVASGDPPTVLSAAKNNARRVGADMVMVLDTRGKVIASSVPVDAQSAQAIQRLLHDHQPPAFVVLGPDAVPYQLVLAPVRTPEPIAWVAMGFIADDPLAQSIKDLVGSEAALVVRGSDGTVHVATTLKGGEREQLLAVEGDAPPRGAGAELGAAERPHLVSLAGTDYLSLSQPLEALGASVDVQLLEPNSEVLAPYVELRKSMLAIDGIALLMAALLGAVLGRTASRPIGELARAAQRIQQGHYDTTVSVSGGDEFRSLAQTFNAMQRNIAEREAARCSSGWRMTRSAAYTARSCW